MEPRVLDSVKSEKEKAIARFHRFRRDVKLWQFFQVLVAFGLISWSSACFPAVLETTGVYFVEFSAYLFNHHVVFLLGNAIIVSLLVLFRENDDANFSAGGVDLYVDYTKYSEAAHRSEPSQSPPPPDEEADSGYEEKQIVACTGEQATKAIPHCDEVAAAIEKATKQINRFQRTQSEKLRREIAVRPRPELRRCETDNCLKTVSSGSLDAAEIEALSSEEFRRRVDAFIDKHWSNKKTKCISFAER